jgi:hypothetical protein
MDEVSDAVDNLFNSQKHEREIEIEREIKEE